MRGTADVTRLSVVAIIAAYNEADIIGQVVGDFVAQGVGVWVIDNASTDATVAAVEPYVGRGVLAIERFPAHGHDGVGSDRYPWASLLRRKEALARELDADWFIHNDADEFRESPWPHLDLREAIERVDRAGYNAIDSARFDFWPVDDTRHPGDDVREAFRFYEPAPLRDSVQIRCWKKHDGPVDLASSGGHEVGFPGRKVFPLRFIIRHYPIRGQAHGERKVFVERRPRFLQEERDRGWHVQYDDVREGASFVRDRATLARWDPEAVRLELVLRHRGVEELDGERSALRLALEETMAALRARAEDLARVEAERDARTAEVERLSGGVERLSRDLGERAGELAHVRRRLDELYASKSWRWTAPLRAAYRAVSGRPA